MMKLSEAIRLGAALVPKTTDAYAFAVDGEIKATCALGAALQAAGKLRAVPWGERQVIDVGCFQELWPYASEPLRTRIIERNDILGWTREQIADYVEEHERSLGLWDNPAAEERTAEERTAEEKEVVAVC